MTLENELREFLAGVQRASSRNISIVLDYYGFSGSPNRWPTLAELAKHHGDTSRERVRQIIEKTYARQIAGKQLPAAAAAAALLQERSFWRESDFLSELRRRGLVTTSGHAPTLLLYLKSQSLASDYELCLPDLQAVTRKRYEDSAERVFTHIDARTALEAGLRTAYAIPGQTGLARLSFVAGSHPDLDMAALRHLLEANESVWTTEFDGDLWFAFEDRTNVLVNNAAKTFAVLDVCPVAQLAEMLANALRRRSRKFSYPDAAMVSRWIAGSKFFAVDNGVASFLGEAASLTAIEDIVADVMREKTEWALDEVEPILLQKGLVKITAHSSVMRSPLVYVDRSGGLTHHRYIHAARLVAEPRLAPSRYSMFCERLDSLDATDSDVITKARNEQRILSEWIFDGDDSADCAFCRRRFGREALVTAHKKKRQHCTDAERRDPHIVFPLCVFGCDYLYERGFLTVRDGLVAPGHAPPPTAEGEIAMRLVGTKVDARWCQGPESYFDNVVVTRDAAAAE